MAELVCVAPSMIAGFWPQVRQMVDEAYAAVDEPMPENIVAELKERKRMLWIAVNDEAEIIAAMVTRIGMARSGRVLMMLACGGRNINDWLGFHARLEQYARAESCVRMQIRGRRGWLRMLPGYREVEVTIERVLA